METTERISLVERVAVLETERTQTRDDIREIKAKLDELLTLKSRGLGALWFIGILLLVGSGAAAFVYNVLNVLGKPHV